MEKWKPINYRGSWNEDPRGELRVRLSYALSGYDSYVAIPIELAQALIELHECGITLIDYDLDGKPTIYICRKPQKHSHKHSNGYLSWEQTDPVVIRSIH
jgi:hypothetical protein